MFSAKQTYMDWVSSLFVAQETQEIKICNLSWQFLTVPWKDQGYKMWVTKPKCAPKPWSNKSLHERHSSAAGCFRQFSDCMITTGLLRDFSTWSKLSITAPTPNIVYSFVPNLSILFSNIIKPFYPTTVPPTLCCLFTKHNFHTRGE